MLPFSNAPNGSTINWIIGSVDKHDATRANRYLALWSFAALHSLAVISTDLIDCDWVLFTSIRISCLSLVWYSISQPGVSPSWATQRSPLMSSTFFWSYFITARSPASTVVFVFFEYPPDASENTSLVRFSFGFTTWPREGWVSNSSEATNVLHLF